MVSGTKWVVGIAAASMAMLPVARAFGEDSPTQTAYRLTVMCAVVASYYEDKQAGLKAMSAADKIGAQLGYDRSRTSADLSTMAAALGTERRTKPDAMEKHRQSCHLIGLAS